MAIGFGGERAQRIALVRGGRFHLGLDALFGVVQGLTAGARERGGVHGMLLALLSLLQRRGKACVTQVELIGSRGVGDLCPGWQGGEPFALILFASLEVGGCVFELTVPAGKLGL